MNIWLVSNSTSTSFMDNTLQLIGLFFLFSFILVATYFTSKFIGQAKLGQLKNKNFKIIETYKVAPNKFLQLVKMGNRYVVISIGKEDIRYITELSEEEITTANGEEQGMKFSDLFAKVQRKQISTKDINGNSRNDKQEN